MEIQTPLYIFHNLFFHTYVIKSFLLYYPVLMRVWGILDFYTAWGVIITVFLKLFGGYPSETKPESPSGFTSWNLPSRKFAYVKRQELQRFFCNRKNCRQPKHLTIQKWLHGLWGNPCYEILIKKDETWSHIRTWKDD